uniref:Putative ovule protein n=1 Tax=Solanum chacoense TaxID=4108 RepID=A0A0V0GGY6_SOLCH
MFLLQNSLVLLLLYSRQKLKLLPKRLHHQRKSKRWRMGFLVHQEELVSLSKMSYLLAVLR